MERRPAMMCRIRVGTTAFTLVELLVVITIVAVIVAMFLPSLNEAKERAREIACMNLKHQLGIAMSVYASDNKTWFPAPVYSTPYFYTSGYPNWPLLVKPYLGNSLKVFLDPSNGWAKAPDDPGNTSSNLLFTYYYFGGYVYNMSTWTSKAGKSTDKPQIALFQDVVHWATDGSWGTYIANHVKHGRMWFPGAADVSNPSAIINETDRESNVRGSSVLYIGGHVKFLKKSELVPVFYQGRYYHYIGSQDDN